MDDTARGRLTADLMDDSHDEVDTSSPAERARDEAQGILQAWLALKVEMGSGGV